MSDDPSSAAAFDLNVAGLKPYEAARLLGITQTSLRAATKRGEVPCWRIGGGTGRRAHVRYSRDALVRLLHSTRCIRVKPKDKATEPVQTLVAVRDGKSRGVPVISIVRRLRYPPIPPAMCLPGQYERVPQSSGVYFVWENGRVVYVGKSSCLAKRATYGHEKITSRDSVSWLLFPADVLEYAEAFYIGVAMPERNFNKHLREFVGRSVSKRSSDNKSPQTTNGGANRRHFSTTAAETIRTEEP